jgi:eukaryotic-like serine/threonine-protein kinase
MSADTPDGERTRDTDFAAMWSSEGATRSFSPSATGTGLPSDLPFLFAPGQRFGPYLIVRPLGKGGMGQVYEAEETDSGRRIAMKILSRGLGDDEERERFLREGRLAASLSHPNTVYVFGTTEVQGFPVIAMELAPGGTLKEQVVDGARLPPAAAVDAIQQVVAGLDAAAALGILHRDVKPSNCFVHADGRVLVGDFGLSVATSSRGGSAASPGTILGTPGFASPEQLRGGALDVRSDIYSVGATIFYLLAGRAPFDDQSTTALLTRVATEPPPSLLTLRPDVPRRLALLVAKCLAKDPADRYSTYAELAAALEPFSSTRLRSAPLVRRLLAGWIDLAVVALPVIALRRFAVLYPLSVSHPLDAVIVALAAIAAMVLYYGLFEAWLGATPTKAMFGLRVVDAGNATPSARSATARALVFGAPIQVITRVATYLAMRTVPNVSTGLVSTIAGSVSIVALFATARRSNGYTALHDRVTGTRVVLKRQPIEARRRQDRTAAEAAPRPPGDTRIGPYLVPSGTAAEADAAVSIEGHDDRLGRRVWIDLLPPGSPALGALRRDLGRPGRARWLAGRRGAEECWDAYEAIEGEPIQAAAASPQPWSRVRHWLADLAHEVAAGLDEGSLPPLHIRRIWIDRGDRGRILDWSYPGSGAHTLDPETVTADLPSAQRLLYAVSVGALLGIPPDAAQDLPPRTPLPLPARALLLSLRAGAFQSSAALLEAVTTAAKAPAIYPKTRRAVQIGVCALQPVLITAISVGGILFSSKGGSLDRLRSLTTLWTTALAVASGTLVMVALFALLGAVVMRGGFTLRGFGAAVVNRHGEPASRFRTLWRAMVTWCPTAVLPFLLGNSGTIAGVNVGTLTLPSLGMALFVGAAVWTAMHPSRSIQDRLAGTWIVPR